MAKTHLTGGSDQPGYSIWTRRPFGVTVAMRREPVRNRRVCVFMLATVLALVASATPSPAQTWPQRPVKFLVTLGPGSGIDIGTRLLADRLSKGWGPPGGGEDPAGGA